MNNQSNKQDKYRYVVLACYIFAALANSIPAHTFSGINSTVQTTFGISQVEVTLNTLFAPIAHTLFAVPCNWLISKYGMRVSFFIGALLLIVGVWLRSMLSEGNSLVCLFGSLLAGVGGMFIYNTPSKLAFNWFKSEAVATVTFVCVLTNLFSNTIGLILPGLFITSQSSQDDILFFLRMEAIIVTIPFLFLLIFFREKPKIDQKITIFNQPAIQKYSTTIKKIFSNTNYMKLAVSMALNYGILLSFLSVQEQVLKGLGYSEPGKAVSVVASSGFVFGIIGVAIFTTIIKKTKAYKYTTATISFGSFAGFTLLGLGFMQVASKTATLVMLTSIYGFCFVSVPSTYILFGGKVASSIDQGSIAGYLFAISQTFGFLVGLCFSEMLDKSELMSQLIICLVAISLLLSFIFLLFVKDNEQKDSLSISLVEQS